MQWAVPFALQIKKVPYRIAPLEQSADRAHAAVGVGVGVSFPSHATLSAAQVWHIVPEKSNNQILGISPYPFPAGGTLWTKCLHLYQINVFRDCKATLNLSSKYIKYLNILNKRTITLNKG